jgi:hypothetical protein
LLYSHKLHIGSPTGLLKAGFADSWLELVDRSADTGGELLAGVRHYMTRNNSMHDKGYRTPS